MIATRISEVISRVPARKSSTGVPPAPVGGTIFQPPGNRRHYWLFAQARGASGPRVDARYWTDSTIARMASRKTLGILGQLSTKARRSRSAGIGWDRQGDAFGAHLSMDG